MICVVHFCGYILELEDAREVDEVAKTYDDRSSEAENIQIQC